MNLDDILIRHDEFIRYCLKPVWSSADYSDIKQDVLMKISAKWHTIKYPLATKAWISRLISNHLTDYFRKKKSEVVVSQLVINDSDRELDGLFVDYDTPEVLTQKKEFCQRLFHAFRELPKVFSVAIKDRFYNQMEYLEIAKKHKIPIGTVRSRISRGKKRLQEELKDATKSNDNGY